MAAQYDLIHNAEAASNHGLALPLNHKRSQPSAERAPEQHGEAFPPGLSRGTQLSARK